MTGINQEDYGISKRGCVVSAFELAEITEGSATGQVAELYDDIRAVIGVPMVNLIFRHMAIIPGCLNWSWQTLRPLYLSGKIADAADALTVGILPGQVVDLTESIAEADLTDDDTCAIDQVLYFYGRANPMNAIGLQVISFALDGSPQENVVGHSQVLTNDILVKPKGLSDLLPMVDPATASHEVRIALHRLALQIHGEDIGVIPSLYRHFGRWPKFLRALEGALEPTLSIGIEDTAKAMLEESKSAARILYLDLPLPAKPPNDQSDNALRKLIEKFPRNICRMTALATLLRRGLCSRVHNKGS